MTDQIVMNDTLYSIPENKVSMEIKPMNRSPYRYDFKVKSKLDKPKQSLFVDTIDNIMGKNLPSK